MTRIIALLSGWSGFWIMVGALLVASAAGAVGGYTARGLIDAPALSHQQTLTAEADKRTAQCIAAHEKGRADGNAGVVTALQTSVRGLTAAISTMEAQRSAREAATDRFLKALANAPKTYVCGGSPAERAYRDSVRDQAPAVAP